MALSGYEKAAIFLGSLGEETAAEVLKDLDLKDIGKITMHMSNMKTVDRAKVEGVLKEATEKIDKGGIQVGGKEFVKKVLYRGLGEDGAGKILDMTSKEKIFRNMSHKAAEILKEEMEARGPVKVSDVEKARLKISRLARKLEAEGMINLPGKGGEDLVV